MLPTGCRYRINAAHYGRITAANRLRRRLGIRSRLPPTPGTTPRSRRARRPAQINAYLCQFDVWDRYDSRRRRQLQRAGRLHRSLPDRPRGRRRGDRRRRHGHDAIWSHRWYASTYHRHDGRPRDRTACRRRPHRLERLLDRRLHRRARERRRRRIRARVRSRSRPAGPVRHIGNTGGAENSTGFWTLYSSGSYGSTGMPAEGIGSKPISMSAYEKIFLGWSNYEVVNPAQASRLDKAGSANQHQAGAAARRPAARQVVATPFGRSVCRVHLLFLRRGNNLDNSMTRQVTLPAGAVC